MLFLFQFKKSFEYGKSSFTIILKNWWHRSRFTDIQSETATEKIKALASRILSRKNFKRKRLLLHQRYQRPKSLWKPTKCSIQKSVKSDRSKKAYRNFLHSNTQYIVETQFFYHSDFTWKQYWRFEKCKICHFNTFRGCEFGCFMNFCTFWNLKLNK